MYFKIIFLQEDSPEFPWHPAIDCKVDAAIQDEQDLGDAARDHGPEGDRQAVPLLAVVIVLQSYELVDVEEDSASVRADYSC